MSKVLQTCELVAKDADIKIDLNCAKEVANKVSKFIPSKLPNSYQTKITNTSTHSLQIYQEIIDRKLTTELYASAPVHPKEKNDRTINWIFLIDSLNFCFWTTDKSHWQVTWNGETYSGYFGLCAAINRAIEVNFQPMCIYFLSTVLRKIHIFRKESI